MIQQFADWLTYDIMLFTPDTSLGESVDFFIYDTAKILLLLLIISWVMGIINAYFPVEQVRRFLTSRRLFGTQYLLASVFGAVTPFCSCSSIPLFIGFVRGGIPLGVTFAFLITSPLVNEVAVAMFLGSFGWRITALYALSGILLGTVGGWLLGRMRLESLLSDWARNPSAAPVDTAAGPARRIRLRAVTAEAFSIPQRPALCGDRYCYRCRRARLCAG